MAGPVTWFRNLDLSERLWLLGGVAALALATVYIALVVASSDDAGSPAAASSTTVSADFDDDDLDLLDVSAAGAVVEEGAVTGRPQHEAVTETEEGWDPVGLDPYEESGDEFFVPALPVEVPVVTEGFGFTSNAVGCESNCITKALLHPKLLVADVGLEVETNVAATITVWVTTNPVEVTDGIPEFPGVLPMAHSDGPIEEWSTDLGPLEFATTYYLVLRATDLYDNSRYAVTDYTTIEPPTPGQLVGNGGGCYYQCIVSGSAMPGDSYDTVLLEVTTSVPVEFDIAVSEQEPGYIDDAPFLPYDEPFMVEEDSGTEIRGSVTGLKADTTYHVVVKAVDENGFSAHAVGEFHTSSPPRVPPPPTDLFVRLERVTIIEDGDPVGKGEIRLVWGFADGSYEARRGTAKIDSGETITLPADSGTWVSVAPGGSLPDFIVNVVEVDHTPYICQSGLSGLYQSAHEHIGCGTRTNVAITRALPLASLNELQACSSFFDVPFGEDRLCIQIESADLGNAWPRFRAIVSFDQG